IQIIKNCLKHPNMTPAKKRQFIVVGIFLILAVVIVAELYMIGQLKESFFDPASFVSSHKCDVPTMEHPELCWQRQINTVLEKNGVKEAFALVLYLYNHDDSVRASCHSLT